MITAQSGRNEARTGDCDWRGSDGRTGEGDERAGEDGGRRMEYSEMEARYRDQRPFLVYGVSEAGKVT